MGLLIGYLVALICVAGAVASIYLCAKAIFPSARIFQRKND